MANERFITAAKGGVFIQEASYEAYEFLTSVGVGPIALPRPDREARYGPAWNAGDFRIEGFIEGEPGEASVTLTRPLSAVSNFLLEAPCSFNAIVSLPCRGSRSIMSNYQLQVLLFNCQFESGEIEQSVVIQPGDNDRINTSGDIVAADGKIIYSLNSSEQTASTTTAANAVAVLPRQCPSECADLVRKGQVAYAGLVSAGYLAADSVIYTEDFGSTWSATTADPWDGNRDVNDILLVETSGDYGYRVIVAGGSDPGHHAEISYSDDKGQTWTDIEVGEMNGQSIEALAIDFRGRIWAVASSGMIYRSGDLGASWTLIDSSTTSEDLNDIVFFDEYTAMAVGDNNTVLVSEDAGDSWSSVTGPADGDAITCVAANYAGDFYVGTDADEIYRTIDEGENWTEVTTYGTGSIEQIVFDPDMHYIGFMVRNDSTGEGHTYRSRDAGVSWDELETIDDDGLHSVAPVDLNECFVVGDPSGGTTHVANYSA